MNGRGMMKNKQILFESFPLPFVPLPFWIPISGLTSDGNQRESLALGMWVKRATACERERTWSFS